MDQPLSHLRVKRVENIAVVEFADRKILDELSIQEIGDELAKLVSSEPGLKLVLNFHNVEHLSSAALGMLITLKKRVDESSGALKLADISKTILEVFRITRLNKMFDIHDTTAEALDGFGAS
jgi:anti-sigma B factor antagonist